MADGIMNETGAKPVRATRDARTSRVLRGPPSGLNGTERKIRVVIFRGTIKTSRRRQATSVRHRHRHLRHHLRPRYSSTCSARSLLRHSSDTSCGIPAHREGRNNGGARPGDDDWTSWKTPRAAIYAISFEGRHGPVARKQCDLTSGEPRAARWTLTIGRSPRSRLGRDHLSLLHTRLPRADYRYIFRNLRLSSTNPT